LIDLYDPWDKDWLRGSFEYFFFRIDFYCCLSQLELFSLCERLVWSFILDTLLTISFKLFFLIHGFCNLVSISSDYYAIYVTIGSVSFTYWHYLSGDSSLSTLSSVTVIVIIGVGLKIFGGPCNLQWNLGSV